MAVPLPGPTYPHHVTLTFCLIGTYAPRLVVYRTRIDASFNYAHQYDPFNEGVRVSFNTDGCETPCTISSITTPGPDMI